MTSRLPLVINTAAGIPQQMPEGDTVAMIAGGVGQIIRGNVEQQIGNTQIPYDNTPPRITEGTQLWSATITPVSETSNILIEFAGFIDISKINIAATIAIFRGSTLIGYAVTSSTAYNGNMPASFAIKINDPSPGLIETTYSCRVGVNSNNTTWYFGRGSGETQGGINRCGWSVSEEL